jgi:alkylhydroperoxidase family enzyme
MPVQRLPALAPPYPAEVGATIERMMPGGAPPIALFRTIAHHPGVLERFRTTGALLLRHGTLEPRDREIVLLRTTARCGAGYEWGVHVAGFSAEAGLTPEQVRATAEGEAGDPAWREQDRALVRLADALHDTGGLDDGLWDELAARYAPDQLIELIAVAGFYHLVSFLANALRVEPEAWAAELPARTAASPRAAR